MAPLSSWPAGSVDEAFLRRADKTARSEASDVSRRPFSGSKSAGVNTSWSKEVQRSPPRSGDPLALMVAAILGGGIHNVIIALTVATIPGYARVMHGLTLSIKEDDYILVQQAMGASDIRTMVVHILPNALPPVGPPQRRKQKLMCRSSRRSSITSFLLPHADSRLTLRKRTVQYKTLRNTLPSVWTLCQYVNCCLKACTAS